MKRGINSPSFLCTIIKKHIIITYFNIKIYALMKFAHSFWSKPLLKSKFANIKTSVTVNIVDYACSVSLIHKFGHTITLYTDAIGAEMFKDIPYDNVVILENYITNNYHFAASFKFIALEHMSLDETLIDGDILFLKEEIFNKIANTKSDGMFSVFEPKDFIANDKARNILMLNNLRKFKFSGIYKTPKYENCNGWINTSLMHFNNQQFKDEYIEQYKKHLALVENSEWDSIWPDIILEQYHLTQLAEKKKYTVEFAVPDFPSQASEDYAVNIGFVHLGSSKRALHTNVIRLFRDIDKEKTDELNEKIPLIIKMITELAERSK